MSYTPWMAGAAHAAKKLNAVLAAKHRESQYQDYKEYRAESRACGYEVESFEQWLGESSLRAHAELHAEYEMAHGA